MAGTKMCDGETGEQYRAENYITYQMSMNAYPNDIPCLKKRC
jgi:hypothetical protein